MTFVLNVTVEWHCRVTSNSCMIKMKIILSPCHISILYPQRVCTFMSHIISVHFFSSSYFFLFSKFLIHHSFIIFYARLYILSSVLVLISSFLKTLLCHFLLQTRVNWFIGKTRVISFLVLCFFFKNVFLLCLILYFFSLHLMFSYQCNVFFSSLWIKLIV